MAEPIVARDAELGAVERFLDVVSAEPAVLLIEGEPGIGKTTLWLEAMRAAGARGYSVLQARPAESEATLSFAAISDLIGDSFEETRAGLPVPQQRALAAALV